MDTPTLIALLHGPDQPGLVARVSGWIFARGGNILHADQHRDRQAGIFFQRVEWVPTGAAGVAEREAADFLAFADSLGMQARVLVSSRRARSVRGSYAYAASDSQPSP
jgi:formyltetrahydrofolate deformylase